MGNVRLTYHGSTIVENLVAMVIIGAILSITGIVVINLLNSSESKKLQTAEDLIDQALEFGLYDNHSDLKVSVLREETSIGIIRTSAYVIDQVGDTISSRFQFDLLHEI